jgi:hypothetical protein
LCTDLGVCNTYVYVSYWEGTLCTDLGDCNTYVYDLLGKDIVY